MHTSIVPTRRGSLRAAVVGIVAFAMLGVPHAGAATPVATPQGCTPFAIASPAASSGANGATPTAAATEAPAQAEQNPAGDIPDSQAFVTYTSAAGGYAIAMPEGWARQETGPNVTFSDKLHAFSVSIFCADTAPTDATARAETQPGGSLQASTPGFELAGISDVQLPAGQAVHITYRADSAPDDVTGKQHRVDMERFELFHNGKVAVITLSTPAGSDNVDVARQVSESLTWQA
ncbi:MAG: hypothetical protein WBA46_15055 [Thermomicrobiales bacterium]